MKIIKKLLVSSLVVLGFTFLNVNANAACGKLVIAEQNWSPAKIISRFAIYI